jgi:hypothetical protein
MAPMNTLAPSKSVTVRDPKGLKFVSIVEAAYNKAGLSEEEAQRVNETSGLSDLIGTFIAEHRVTNEYANEEVKSSKGYPGYKKPKKVAEQVKIIHGLFPEVKWGYFRPDESKIAVPDDAEGLFAIPRWKKIAPTYEEACEKVFALLKKARNGAFTNYREGELGPKQLRLSARTAEAYEKLDKKQNGYDILLLPAQFGIRHRGRSVRRARAVFTGNEFGLDPFAIGIMLLTHPGRLQHYDDLWIDCAGAEFAPDADGVFSWAPCFGFRDDLLRFEAHVVGPMCGGCGSASWFSPQ